MSTTMIAPKILELDRTGSRSAGEGADCFDLVKMFGSRILRLAKYITGSDPDAEAVALEACFLRARLREKLARSFRPGLPSIEESLRGDNSV